jgi:DNA-binding transcriptional ArsR family regulator
MHSDIDWDVIGCLVSSRYRIAVADVLAEHPATPSQLAREAEEPMSHISRAISELRAVDVVELLVSEDTRKGRIYGLSEFGERAVAQARDDQLL